MYDSCPESDKPKDLAQQIEAQRKRLLEKKQKKEKRDAKKAVQGIREEAKKNDAENYEPENRAFTVNESILKPIEPVASSVPPMILPQQNAAVPQMQEQVRNETQDQKYQNGKNQLAERISNIVAGNINPLE